MSLVVRDSNKFGKHRVKNIQVQFSYPQVEFEVEILKMSIVGKFSIKHCNRNAEILNGI